MEISPGAIVLSKAGRDTGRLFIIKELIDKEYAVIIDGDLRKVEKPKKKKIKHLQVTGEIAEEISQKLYMNKRITDAEIRKALSSIKNESSTSI